MSTDLNSLRPMFDEDDLDINLNPDQLKKFFNCFEEDFIKTPYELKGKIVKVILKKSRIPDLTEYPETFAHIITRDLKSQRDRFFDCHRANRIHWIKPILENRSSKKILSFKWKDDRGVCRDHYWYFEKDFMVVVGEIGADAVIITSFCVDQEEKAKYHERYRDYKDGKSNC